MISMKITFKKILFIFIFQFMAIIMLFAQENRTKDSLTIDETWKLLSTYEKLSFDDGLEIIFLIKYDKADSVKYRLLTDSIWNFIYKPLSQQWEENQRFSDSIRNCIKDTLPYSLVINGSFINDYDEINFYISYIENQDRIVLKLNKHDNLLILPPYNLSFDSVFLILQYKEIYLVDKVYLFKHYYHIMGLEYIHETVPYYIDNYCLDNNYIRERARTNNSEGFLYICYTVYGDGTCREELIPDLKKYYKIGRQLVGNK